MKKTLKTGGALGLAAVTVLTGLSFGPAAASAAPADAGSASALASGEMMLIGQAGPSTFYGQPSASEYWNIRSYPTREAAELRAATLDLVSYGPDFSIRVPAGTSGMCIGDYNGATVTINVECGTERSLFHADSDGRVIHSASGMFIGPPRGAQGYTYFSLTDAKASALRFEGVKPAFNGVVDSLDVAARTASVSGRAAANATVIINGEQEVLADADGAWSATVTGLKLGANTISLEQWEDGEKTAEATVEAPIDVAPVVASATFPTDRTQSAVVSGTAHPGSTVVVQDADGTELARTTASSLANGAWSVELPAPNAGGARAVTVHQEIDGEVNGEIAATVAYGAAVSVTGPVDDAAHDGGPVAMRGTGEAGAQVTVREQGRPTVLGTATVLANGSWTLSTTAVDTRTHVLEATQAGKGANTTTSAVTLNPEADVVTPVTVESPENGSTVTTSRPAFTGHGEDGATVTIGYGANSIIGTAVVENGEWTITPTRGLGMGVSTLIVTQTAGSEVSQLTHTLTRVAVEQPLAVTSHVDGQTYAEGVTTFRGTAPAGSAIRATNQWGTPMGTATATDGTWSFNRNLGPTTAGYDLTFVATPPVGAPQTVSLKLLYTGNLAFQVTSPVDNSTYTVGTTTFTGTAAPGTTVAATNQWGTSMGKASTALSTAWAFDRYLGPTSAGYDITFVATKGTDTQRTTLHLNTTVVNQPVAVTSTTDGATYRPGLNTLTGTGTPGATIDAVNATNGWNVPMGRATVGADGTWALPERNWGPSNDYAIQVTQTNPDTTTSSTTVVVKAPVFAPLTLTSPTVGDTYDTGVSVLFEGTATPFATVSVRSAQSDTTYRTVEADVDGNWSFTRVWGPTHDYVLNIDQLALDGQTGDAITGFAWKHSGN